MAINWETAVKASPGQALASAFRKQRSLSRSIEAASHVRSRGPSLATLSTRLAALGNDEGGACRGRMRHAVSTSKIKSSWTHLRLSR